MKHEPAPASQQKTKASFGAIWRPRRCLMVLAHGERICKANCRLIFKTLGKKPPRSQRNLPHRQRVSTEQRCGYFFFFAPVSKFCCRLFSPSATVGPRVGWSCYTHSPPLSRTGLGVPKERLLTITRTPSENHHHKNKLGRSRVALLRCLFTWLRLLPGV